MPRVLREAEGAGLRFEMVEVLGWGGLTKRNHRLWRCRCACGKEFEAEMCDLRSRKVVSCGHLKVEKLGRASITHGAARKGADPLLERTFRIWADLKKRCGNPNSTAYKHYGGRGISVSADWGQFQKFLEDMGVCPPDYSLERLNNNGNYEAGNCEWIPRKHQAKNRRDTIKVAYRGSPYCLKDLCGELGVPYLRTYKRFVMRGWSLHRAIGVPAADVMIISKGKRDQHEDLGHK